MQEEVPSSITFSTASIMLNASVSASTKVQATSVKLPVASWSNSIPNAPKGTFSILVGK